MISASILRRTGSVGSLLIAKSGVGWPDFSDPQGGGMDAGQDESCSYTILPVLSDIKQRPSSKLPPFLTNMTFTVGDIPFNASGWSSK